MMNQFSILSILFNFFFLNLCNNYTKKIYFRKQKKYFFLTRKGYFEPFYAITKKQLLNLLLKNEILFFNCILKKKIFLKYLDEKKKYFYSYLDNLLQLSKHKKKCVCFYNALVRKENNDSFMFEKTNKFCKIVSICLCYKEIIKRIKCSSFNQKLK